MSVAPKRTRLERLKSVLNRLLPPGSRSNRGQPIRDVRLTRPDGGVSETPHADGQAGGGDL
jgi:hypothetical protein